MRSELRCGPHDDFRGTSRPRYERAVCHGTGQPSRDVNSLEPDKMCVTNTVDTPTPVATNFGLGQCAGSGTCELHGRARRRPMLPASVGATDGHDGFDVLFGEGDDSASPDMQLVLQEMICNPEEKGEAAEHVKESM
ncbi:hypothetical protein QBC34DRAFT_397792 [Podospora aff. communis PSN243]|uniref:Uncharacterized protein n=1 Tax=Podospora aff. communis PSN243 TaxID=3040156 RepID=A0AAV9GYX0_9PEZI|nr:hypothetical protein QBC34DRAFT_397792 [Podospora aff. communis PSN243]